MSIYCGLRARRAARGNVDLGSAGSDQQTGVVQQRGPILCPLSTDLEVNSVARKERAD